ncbi:MAG: DUF3567 domain-containing protein [Burkholderiales bacterium]|nr:DUF3567 domain-containing protein [Burkholderiales bacterium]MDE2628094.1 DUF3567 domain-containing protein [Burkholderiales bacterium]
MQMLYNSDSYAVVLFDVAAIAPATATVLVIGEPAPEPLSHGGYEIVDKFARKEIFLQGAMAESFKEGVEALIQTRPSEEEIDDYIERFTSLMQQPVILH